MKKIIIIVAALGLVGCQSSAKLTLDPSIAVKVKAGAANASEKAQASLVAICNNYPLVDAAFNIAVATGYIPQRYAQAEAQAVSLLVRTCAAPPADAAASYRVAIDAWTTVINVRSQFRTAAKVAVLAQSK